MGHIIGINEVFGASLRCGFFVRIYYDELYFHFFGHYALYVNRTALALLYSLFKLGKTCKIGGKLNEYAVALYAPYRSRNGLPRRVFRRIFLPRAEKLLGGNVYSAAFSVYALYYYLYFFPWQKSVRRMRYPRYRYRIDGQKRYYSTTYIYKSAKRLKMRYPRRYYIAGDKVRKITARALPLRLLA